MTSRRAGLTKPMLEGSLLRRAAIALFPLAALAASKSALANDLAAKPLPDARPFLEAVRESLRSDEALFADYTFTEKNVETKLDGKGAVKSRTTKIYEVYPSTRLGRIYRRLVMVDGKPVDPKQLADEDRKQDEKTEKRRLERENETAEQKQRRAQRDEERRRREREVVEELFQMDDIQVAGREMLNGRSTILVTFHPKPGFRPRTKGGKVLQKLAGRAWIDEEERQLVKIDAELLDGLGVGPAGVFRLQKGARAYFERRRVNGEIWLPAQAHFVGAAKVLLFVLGRLDARSEYSDYRKFSVSSEAEVGDVEQTPN
jgi:hypothetical protein